MSRIPVCLLIVAALSAPCFAAESSLQTADTFSGLELRGLGPALMSGRVVDVAKNPDDPSVWYVAVASGGVWKTENNGTTWKPIFDEYGSYSIGCVTVDPSNPHIVWVGTGENNSQRSAGYGDGVYKSLDGGESFQQVGLEASEHIGKIVLDPRDSNVVWVAAQGPLWAPGGDRGLYKSTDGGATWTQALEIGENTGVTDVVLDPRDPDTIYAAAFQRRRRQWGLVAGGPKSGIHKSTDGGATWRELTSGLPAGDMGRIGLALSPQQPDVLYATIPALDDEGGFYRSATRGESWRKMSDYVPVDPQYYQEIFPDPHRFDRVYSMDVWIQVSEDGGATWSSLNSENKHVDNHHLLFDAVDPDYLLVGCDGGIYESWDRGDTWKFVANLPVTQFYRVGVDDEAPFYNVYGGTQDNNSQGAPSRTTNVHGIRNSDWINTVGGDGYQTRVEPGNPDILYSLWQYGGLVRYDRASGEILDLQPQPGAGEPPINWNWDSPLLISPHSPTRLYFAGNRLFRSDDRGDTWTAVSPDLSRGIDRNRLEIMGTVWGVDTVWKNVFTSWYGSIVAFDESPRVEGLLYAGTDDGLIQISEDGGVTWRAVESESVGGPDPESTIPERTYVSDLTASRHDADTVYATFNNHKSGDFEPYVARSGDRGRTWRSIRSDLPARHVAWSIVEDPVDPELLFLGTELGLFFTRDGGGNWTRLEGGLPTVAIRDLEIQPRESDLVVGTFGRGIYILDDYSPLRLTDETVLEAEATLFPVKDPWMYIPSRPLGWGEKAEQGHAFFTAPNPPFGAVFTYYLKDGYRSTRDARREVEKALQKEGEPVYYEDWDDLRREDWSEDPEIFVRVTDASGQVVRHVPGPVGSGFHRIAWDLRYPASIPTTRLEDDDPWEPDPSGPLAAPGAYTAQLFKRVDDTTTALSEPKSFEARPLGTATLPAVDRDLLLAFQRKAARLQRAVLAAADAVDAAMKRIAHLELALAATPSGDDALRDRLRAIELDLHQIQVAFDGDVTIRSRFELVPPSLVRRVQRVMGALWTSTSAPTTTHQRNYDIAAEGFAPVLTRLRELIEITLPALEQDLDAAGAPWTPGRVLPDWSPE
jgi:photosystem II stability/assembly factor-like uncharacterized protein